MSAVTIQSGKSSRRGSSSGNALALSNDGACESLARLRDDSPNRVREARTSLPALNTLLLNEGDVEEKKMKSEAVVMAESQYCG